MIKTSIAAMLIMFAQDLTFSGLNAPNYDEKGKLKTLLKSKFAEHKNYLFHLKAVQLEVFGKNKQVVTTPGCSYSPHDKLLKGKERLRISDQTMEISGLGFDCDLNTKILNIHDEVVIYIKRNKEDEK